MLLLDQAFSPPGTAGGQPTQSDADKAEMAYLGRKMMHLHQERAPRVLEGSAVRCYFGGSLCSQKEPTAGLKLAERAEGIRAV